MQVVIEAIHLATKQYVKSWSKMNSLGFGSREPQRSREVETKTFRSTGCIYARTYGDIGAYRAVCRAGAGVKTTSEIRNQSPRPTVEIGAR